MQFVSNARVWKYTASPPQPVRKAASESAAGERGNPSMAATPLPKTLYHRLDGKRVQGPLLLLWLTVLMLLCVAALASQSYNPFIYFRF